MSRPSTQRAGGFTLVEVMVAMSILLISLLALADLQITSARANRASDRTLQASAMATDLVENVRRWSYTDARLQPVSTTPYASPNDPTIAAKWDMGLAAGGSYQAEFSDSPSTDPAATTSNALALGGGYQGLSANLSGGDGGTPDFGRYWNVYLITLPGNNSGQENGKLVQIIVRWMEPGYGYRQVTASQFKLNPKVLSQ